MSRTIELGRAVLDSSTAKLQLWVTTLITILPQQDSTDVQHLSSQALLDWLLSSNVWVGRGNGMHIVLELTANGEPVGSRHLGVLAQQIINAPVWGQLGLRPSLPKDERSDDALPFEPGKLQINIKHAREDTEIEGKKCHRISSNVPFADITPTEGVPYVGLMSVRFAMEIIRIQPSIKPTRPKRRRKLERTYTFKADSEDGEVPKLTKLPTELEDTYNGGEYGILWSEQRGDEGLSHTFDPSPKRHKRPSTLPNMGPGSGVPIMELLHNVENQTRPSTGSSPERVLTESCQSPVLELETLVDAAIRLAVCSSLPKPATGVKVKANTFTGGLTDVAPTLWSPGYLPAFAQRSHFLPVITRSLSKTAGERARSLSLQDKIAQLTARSSRDVSIPGYKYPRSNGIEKNIVKPLNARLWMYMQRNLLNKTASWPLLAFCATNTQISTPSSPPDQMLDSILTHVEARVHSQAQVQRIKNVEEEYLEAMSTSRISSTLEGSKQTFVSGPPRSTTRFETLALGQEDDKLLLTLQHPAAGLKDAHVPKPFLANLVGSTHELSQGASEFHLGSAKEDLLLEDRVLQFGGDKESTVQPLWLNKDVGKTEANEDMLLTF